MVDYIRALTLAWNAATKGKSPVPSFLIQVGPAIWAYFNEHLVANVRFVDDSGPHSEGPRVLAFKSAKVMLSSTLAPDEYRFYTQVCRGRCSEPQANGTGYGG